jgi:hypothetical protein
MKSTILALSSAAFFYLASGFPLSLRQAAGQVIIDIQTGDGDSAVAFGIDPNTIVPTSQSGGSSGVDASTETPGFTCQAFSDAVGTTPLGSTFSSTTDGVFFNNCAKGGLATSCVLVDAVKIGAFCCGADADFKTKCLSNVKSGGWSTGVSSDVTNIIVELQGADELAIQLSVPDDGSIAVVGGEQRFDSAFIVDGANNVNCQTFSDVKGTKKVGSSFGTEETSLDGGKETLVQAVSCKSN